MATEESIIRIPPYHYIHVLDQNSNVSRVEVGPKTYIRQDNERILFDPVRMVTIPLRHYCVVANPVVRDAQGSVVLDVTGQARLRHADMEIRLTQDPFPLYPGELMEKVPGLPPPPHPSIPSTRHLVPGCSPARHEISCTKTLAKLLIHSHGARHWWAVSKG